MTYSKLETTAFLAALVATPAHEPLPPLNKDLFVPDPSDFLEAAETKTLGSAFWQNYRTFLAQLMAGYTAKERNKIIESAVTAEESDRFAGEEITNISLSAEEIILSPDPISTARKAFETSKQEPLDWAETLTQWQP
ncbi:MAG: hypothetical protein EA366_15650 [Spirulina sp. DLM2.Bin59]|nr:MAG: hypothetical protein EA366_15650 [Spirulina sp. DLM2.Bin59]